MTDQDGQPLYHRTKWTADDKNRLITEVMRGGDWPHRAAKQLGRTAVSCYGRARKIMDDEGSPIGFRDRTMAGYEYIQRELQEARKGHKLPRKERERLEGSFQAVAGYQVPYTIRRKPGQTVVIIPPEEPKTELARRKDYTPPRPRERDVILSVKINLPKWTSGIVRRFGGKGNGNADR